MCIRTRHHQHHNRKQINPTDCPALVLADPIQIAAASFKNKATVRRGALYKLQVTLTLPAANSANRRLLEEAQRELNNAPHGSKTPVSTTDYALLVTPPAGQVVTYRSTGVRPPQARRAQEARAAAGRQPALVAFAHDAVPD